MDSISGLVKKATTTSQKAKAARKLENQGVKVNMPRSRLVGSEKQFLLRVIDPKSQGAEINNR